MFFAAHPMLWGQPFSAAVKQTKLEVIYKTACKEAWQDLLAAFKASADIGSVTAKKSQSAPEIVGRAPLRDSIYVLYEYSFVTGSQQRINYVFCGRRNRFVISLTHDGKK